MPSLFPRRRDRCVIAAVTGALLVSTVPALASADIETAATHSVPKWIDASGQQDVTRALQKFVDSVPDGSTIVFPDKAFYRLNAHGLRLDNRRDLTLEGNGTKLKSRGCDPDDSVIAIGQRGPSSRITIRDFVLAGDNRRAGKKNAYKPGCGYAHGVSIHRSRHVEIDDVTIKRVNGDCVYVGGGGYERSHDVFFHDSVCKLTGRQGVAITAGTRVRVERVGFWNIAIIAFDIEPNERRDGAVDIVFTRNRVGRTGRSKYYRNMFFGANGNLRAVVRNVEVSHNTAYKQPLRVLVGDEDKGWGGGRNHHDIKFVGNRSLAKARGPVLQFKHVDGLVIRDIDQPLSSGPLARIIDTVGLVYKP